jgi:hypothetical protein
LELPRQCSITGSCHDVTFHSESYFEPTAIFGISAGAHKLLHQRFYDLTPGGSLSYGTPSPVKNGSPAWRSNQSISRRNCDSNLDRIGVFASS